MTDFAAYQQWFSAQAIIGSQLLIIPADTSPPLTFGPVSLLGFNGVELHVQPGTVSINVVVTFSVDGNIADGTPIICDWNLTSTTNLDVVIPAAAQFVTISFQSNTANAATALVYATAVNNAFGGYRWLAPNPEQVTSATHSYAAGSDVITPLPNLMAVDAFFACLPVDATGMLEFRIITLTNSGNQAALLWKVTPTSTTSSASVRCRLPAQPCGVHVVNNDASNAHEGGWAMIPGLAGC